jgi:hypothetical protein
MRMVIPLAAALSVTLLPGVALAETSAERNACMGDAFRVCWSEIPDRHGVFLCLMKHKDELSDDCRTVMNHYDHPQSETTGSGSDHAQSDSGWSGFFGHLFEQGD